MPFPIRRFTSLAGSILLAVATPLAAEPAQTAPADWPSFRGPRYDGAVADPVFTSPDRTGLALAWKHPLGSGYSSVSIAEGKAVTLFSDGTHDGAAAFDAATGAQLWRSPLAPTYTGHDGSHTGPISTPAIANGKVFALLPRGELFALALADGKTLWSTQIGAEHGGKKPHYGFSTSPLIAGGVLVVETGAGEGKSIAGFDPADGRRLWAIGGDGVSYQSPLAITWEGRELVLAVGDENLYGLDPATGGLLWQVPHGGDQSPMGGGSMNPVPAGDGRFLLDSKGDSSALVALRREGEKVVTEEVWVSKGLRGSYSTPVYHEGYFYGYNGAFLSCVSAATGEVAWKSRPPGDGFAALVDGHLVVATKKGTLHLAKASPEGWRELASLALFGDYAWTPPSFAGGRIFARSLSEVASVELRAVVTATVGSAPEPGSAFGELLSRLATTEDKTAAVDAFLATVESYPLVEGRDLVHFLYRGPAQDMGISGDMLGSRREEPMTRVPGTDLFYYSVHLEPDAVVRYRFIKNLDEKILDPRNPRTALADGPGMSWFGMPAWREAEHLREAAPERRGRIESFEIESPRLEGKRRIDVYLPVGYDTGERRYPVAYVHEGQSAQEQGRLPASLDNLAGAGVTPMIAVFIHQLPPGRSDEFFDKKDAYADILAEELVPMIDTRYRTQANAAARASIGQGFAGFGALYVGFRHPEVFSKIAAQSAFMLSSEREELEKTAPAGAERPLKIYMDWGRYDLRADHEGWNVAAADRQLAEFLRARGHAVVTHEGNHGFGWEGWRNRSDVVLGTLFPAEP